MAANQPLPMPAYPHANPSLYAEFSTLSSGKTCKVHDNSPADPAGEKIHEVKFLAHVDGDQRKALYLVVVSKGGRLQSPASGICAWILSSLVVCVRPQQLPKKTLINWEKYAGQITVLTLGMRGVVNFPANRGNCRALRIAAAQSKLFRASMTTARLT